MRTDTTNDLNKLVQENIKLSKAILRSTEKTRKALRWMRVMSILRLLIIVVPIILALIYVPPFLSKMNELFGGLYGGEQFNILNQFKNLDASGMNLEGLLNNNK